MLFFQSVYFFFYIIITIYPKASTICSIVVISQSKSINIFEKQIIFRMIKFREYKFHGYRTMTQPSRRTICLIVTYRTVRSFVLLSLFSLSGAPSSLINYSLVSFLYTAYHFKNIF